MADVVEYEVPSDILERLDALSSQVAIPIVALVAELAQERDEAVHERRDTQRLLNRMAKALQALVDAYPETSWSSSNDAREAAVALLDEIAQAATMEQTAPPHSGE